MARNLPTGNRQLTTGNFVRISIHRHRVKRQENIDPYVQFQNLPRTVCK